MFVDTSTSTTRGGATYTRHLLRESYREDGKVKHRTIANLSHCTAEEVAAIRLALKHKASLQNLGTVEDLRTEQGKSVGAVWVLYQVARELGIVSALGTSRQGKLALWQVLARSIDQGSRLSAVRLAGSHAACEVLGLEKFDEDDLYENLEWLCEHQARIEDALFAANPSAQSSTLFLYDVTSSYFEGTQNALAAFGYNRDGKRGKRQVVIGLLCNEAGRPLSIEVFPGNTQDPKTVSSQISKLKSRFHVDSITFVGDRGMIKSRQIEDLAHERFHYITAITKPQIEALLKQGTLQLSLFDEEVAEVITEDGIRYVLRRNPQRAMEMSANREDKLRSLNVALNGQNEYLAKHKHASVTKANERLVARITRLKISKWVSIECVDRTLSAVVDEARKAEAAKLDGCYVLKTDLRADEASKVTIHDRYKDLALVERAFRTSKTSHLELRPIFLRREDRTRGHALVVMLAYQIVQHLTQAWSHLNLTVLEGIQALSSLCLSRVVAAGVPLCEQVPTPRADVAELLRAANIQLPKVLPAAPPVSTRKKLQSQRNRFKSRTVRHEAASAS